MVSIDTYNACVDFPIFDAKSRSLKKAMLSTAGGSIGKNDQNVVMVEALKDINLHLREGDRVGLVGHNGAGKTTLLRLLSGIYEPTRGAADVRGRVAPVFDLGVGMDPEVSGYDNIIIRGLFLGQTIKQMKAKMDEIAEFSELGDYLSMPLRTYSTGMRVRLQDLVKRSGILVFASHSNDFLAQLCDTALWIDHGQIRSVGEVSDVVGQYEGPEVGEYVRDLRKRFDNEENA